MEKETIKMKKIVVTGPESTGKSTLTQELASHYSISFVQEYARAFIDELDREYIQSDLIEIAKGQLNLENQIINQQPNILLCDTDLLTIKIWSEFKYGICDSWILEQLDQNLPDLFLLCSPDFAWKFDEQREHPERREELFSIYEKEIINLGVKYHIISGEERLKKTISLI